jgi:hypothetical protein
VLRTLVYSGNTRGPSPGCTGLLHRWCTGGSAPVRTECAAGGAHTCGTTTAVASCTPAEQPWLYMAIYPCHLVGYWPCTEPLLHRWCTGGAQVVPHRCAPSAQRVVRTPAEPPPQWPAAHLLNSPGCTWLFTLAIPRGIARVPAPSAQACCTGGAQVVHRWFRTGAHRVRSGWCAHLRNHCCSGLLHTC